MAFSFFKKKSADTVGIMANTVSLPDNAVPKNFSEELRANGASDEITFSSDGAGAELLIAALGGRTVITAETAMQIPSVARCVNMIAGAAAMLPVRMYRRHNGKVEEITNDPRIDMLNRSTGDTMSADSMRHAWVIDFLLCGSAYSYIERKYGIPYKLFYVSEKNVSVLKNTEDVIHKHYVYNICGKTYYPCEILKILRNSDGFGRGRGIVQDNPMIIDTAFNMIKFQKNQMIKGGSKKGFLKADKPLTQKTMDEIRNRWKNLYSNESDEGVMLLNDGIDFKEISSTSVEMQINQNIQTNNAEIMKLFGTSDGILSESTVKNAVMPVLDVMEAAFDDDLLLEEEKGGVYFAFDTRELTRGDIAARYSAYAVALQNNFMQLDEVRALEDLPPTGFNMLKLGLQDVLLDPNTGKIYTPNTNAMVDIGMGAGANVGEPVDKSENDDIISVRGNPNHDPTNGRFTFSKAKMSKQEIKRVSCQFATDFPEAVKGRTYPYENRNHFYLVKVNAFGNYNFRCKILIKGNEEKIRAIRRIVESWKD